MKILFLSHTFYGGKYRVGSHELYEIALAKGFDVLHVSTPRTPFHYLKAKLFGNGEKKRYDREKSNSRNRVPFTWIPIQLVASKWLPGKDLLSNIRPYYDLIFIDQPYFLRYKKFFNSESRIFLRLTDLITEKKQRKLILDNTSLICGFSVTNELIISNLGISNNNTIVIPNGSSLTVSKVEINHKEKRGIVYIGALDARIDWQMVDEISKSPNFQYLHLYGTGKIPKKLPEGVTYMGAIDFESSLSVMSNYEYLILPYIDNLENRARSPMKVPNAIELGLNLIVPVWMLHVHSQIDENFSITINDFTSGKFLRNSNLAKRKLNRQKSWEENFDLLIEWAIKVSDVTIANGIQLGDQN